MIRGRAVYLGAGTAGGSSERRTRLRALAADATTDTVKKHLGGSSREHERLAGGPEIMEKA